MSVERGFDADKGDRVAKPYGVPGKLVRPAQCAGLTLQEAYDYALMRADLTGKRQFLKKGTGPMTKNWWLVIVKEEAIESQSGHADPTP